MEIEPYNPTWADHSEYSDVSLFLDTTLFWKSKFSFESQELRGLLSWGRSQRVKVLLTSILRSEINSGIERSVGDFVQFARKFRRQAQIINGTDAWSLGDLLKRPPTDEILEAVKLHFWSKIESINSIEISLPENALELSLDRYFSSIPPFGKGAKRKEFPDALNIIALEKYAQSNRVVCTVVSDDPDMIAACEASKYLRHFANISDIAQKVVTADQEFDWIEASIESESEVITEWMTDCLNETPVIAEDEDIEILDHRVTSVEWSRVRFADKELFENSVRYFVVVTADVSAEGYFSVEEVDPYLEEVGAYPYHHNEFTEFFNHRVDIVIGLCVRLDDLSYEVDSVAVDEPSRLSVRFGGKF